MESLNVWNYRMVNDEMNDYSLEQLEEESLYADDYQEVPPPEIVAYNELRSCADLFRMHVQGILEIQPDFQRDIVWRSPDQTRFVDSLIKQLPIPSMCFALDHHAQKWIVIDGLQRISTIVRFLEGGDWKLSKLDDIEPDIAGKSVAAIKTSDTKLHHYYTRVENLSIPVTVLRCDFRKKNHMEYLFTIFHRLNTGGMKLNNQEIRNCIYGGAFNHLLKELDKNKAWRRLNKMKSGQSYRFTKQEIMLRFFAFVDKHKQYEGHLAKFLNDYMHDNQKASEEWINNKRTLFTETVGFIDEAIFDKKAPPKLSITMLEAILVGVGLNIPAVSNLTPEQAKARFQNLKDHEDFSETALREGLSKKLRVIERLDASAGIFGN